MKRTVFCIFLGMMPVIVFSQEFLHSSDYVYGMGHTDSAAIVSLAISIGVNVVGEISYTVSEKDKSISEEFVKTSGISYSRFIKESRPYFSNGIYYRYINKEEYIRERIGKCVAYEHFADSIDYCDVKHKQNLVLGYYYKAYTEIDDPLFLNFTQDYIPYKNSLLSKAKLIYCSGEYGSLYLAEKVNNRYYEVVTNFSSKSVSKPNPSLFAFECNINGEWKMPDSYLYGYLFMERMTMRRYSSPNDGIFFDACTISANNSKIEYRIIYEDINGKIDVPSSWYFETYFMKNCHFLD